MTTSGIACSALEDNIQRRRDFALYRYKGTITEEQKRLLAKHIEESLAKHIPFGYLILFALFLKKKYGIFNKLKKPSVADLIYGNMLQLIGYC